MKILVILMALALAACANETPSGPTVNNSGDDATFCIGARDASCVTPAPVVVPPVVVPPVVEVAAEE
jgi:hypothetical protein